ncbi:DUF2868 domain-containing protein [Oceanospirillum beijerinckii]|uniref:DUF2868 domain-containing protein n=1 Tax=Oceanospirillum beijerinckii TaxID=64976 RepID=UPI0004035150|nr:DUF2868 domain-containing protein [Oceanospirillum beijerinckii]
MSQAANSDVRDFFIKPSVSQGLFRWFDFRQFVERGSTLNLSDGQAPPQSLVQWLALWQRQTRDARNMGYGNQQGFQNQVGVPWWFGLVCLVLGVLTMLGVLMAHAGSAINIWAPLFLFAFLPFIFSLLSGFLPLFISSERRSKPMAYNLLAKHLNLPEFERHRMLLQPWLSGQLQKGASFALLGGLACFFVFATFQQVSFYWSSTFITDSTTMTQVFHWIALPWQWWLDAPGQVLVAASQHRLTAEAIVQGHSSALWQFIVMAVLCYGLLPRLMLIAIFRGQLKRRLSQAIEVSSLFEQFLNRHQQTFSIDPLMPDAPEQPQGAPDKTTNKADNLEKSEPVERVYQDQNVVSEKSPPLSAADLDADIVLGWRLAQPDSRVSKNLGAGSWLDDEAYLESLSDSAVHVSSQITFHTGSQSSSLSDPQSIALLVEAWQTPTGELADVVDIVSEQKIQIELWLTGLDAQPERSDMMLKTWQFFAKQHQIKLRIRGCSAEGSSTQGDTHQHSETGK